VPSLLAPHHAYTHLAIHSHSPPSPPAQVIGSPAEDELGFISSDKARRYIRSLPRAEPTDFLKLWPNTNPKVRLLTLTLNLNTEFNPYPNTNPKVRLRCTALRCGVAAATRCAAHAALQGCCWACMQDEDGRLVVHVCCRLGQHIGGTCNGARTLTRALPPCPDPHAGCGPGQEDAHV